MYAGSVDFFRRPQPAPTPAPRSSPSALGPRPSKGHLKNPKKTRGSRSVVLLRVILTPPATYHTWHQHPHDTNSPPVGRWGNCERKWWPQGTAPSPPQKQNSEHTRQKEVNSTDNGLVAGSICVDVRIGLTLYSSSCSARYELNLFFGGNKKTFAKTPYKGGIRRN
jgi:hypothetical protein